jgi:hypothetical protein
MFCPKCGGQNPENGKFCRSCGTDLGVVSSALSSPSQPPALVNRRGRPISWESSITKFATGIAFLVIAIVLGVTNMAGGRVWWFWMLIPAFTMMGSGVAQYVQLRKAEKGQLAAAPLASQAAFPAKTGAALPPQSTEFVVPESRYKTGDLVPPSVTDGTTRHLEMESESKTMALPKS